MAHGVRALILVVACLATAAPAQPGNLVPAPGFDTEAELIANWENLSADDAWTDLDYQDDPSSGSVAINNMIPGADTGSAVITPCFAVTPGATYRFSAWQFTPSPQPVDGYAQILLQWRESCPSGAFTGGFESASSAATLAWSEIAGIGSAPLGASGARLWLIAVRTPAAGTFSVYFDQAFVPEPDGRPAALAGVAGLAWVRRRRRRVSMRSVAAGTPARRR